MKEKFNVFPNLGKIFGLVSPEIISLSELGAKPEKAIHIGEETHLLHVVLCKAGTVERVLGDGDHHPRSL